MNIPLLDKGASFCNFPNSSFLCPGRDPGEGLEASSWGHWALQSRITKCQIILSLYSYWFDSWDWRLVQLTKVFWTLETLESWEILLVNFSQHLLSLGLIAGPHILKLAHDHTTAAGKCHTETWQYTFFHSCKEILSYSKILTGKHLPIKKRLNTYLSCRHLCGSMILHCSMEVQWYNNTIVSVIFCCHPSNLLSL